MKSILIPTDFSESSEHALRWARLLAQPGDPDAILTLLHVSQPYIPDVTLPSGEVGAGVMVSRELEEIGENTLRERAEQLKQEGVNCRTEYRIGSVESEITDVAADIQADLIVMGRHHFDGFFDRLAGSAAGDVAMTAPCPVLIVPSPEGEGANAVQLKQVVYAAQLEFSENDSLRPVIELVRRFGAELTLVKVRANNQPDIQDDAQFLAELTKEFGTPYQFQTVEADTVTEGLTEFFKTHPADLLVMATRERDFLSRLLNPSLTKRMVLGANVPVLVFHVRETKGADFV